MVALNMTLTPDDYAIAGRMIGEGSFSKVYAFGPFVVKIGRVEANEATIGRCLVRRLGDRAVGVYKFRTVNREGLLFLDRADGVTLYEYMRRRFRVDPETGVCRRGRVGQAERDARWAVLDSVTNVIDDLGWDWFDYHDFNLMVSDRDGEPHWQVIDYASFDRKK